MDTHGHTDRHTHGHTDRQIHTRTYGQTHTRTYGQTYTQGHTDRHTHGHKNTLRKQVKVLGAEGLKIFLKMYLKWEFFVILSIIQFDIIKQRIIAKF